MFYNIVHNHIASDHCDADLLVLLEHFRGILTIDMAVCELEFTALKKEIYEMYINNNFITVLFNDIANTRIKVYFYRANKRSIN